MFLLKYMLLIALTLVLYPVLGKRGPPKRPSYSKLSGFSNGNHRSSAMIPIEKQNNERRLPPRFESGGAVRVINNLGHNTYPMYVYQYKETDSKHDTSLDGVQVINLETHVAHGPQFDPSSYKPETGDVCKFTIKKENGNFEEKLIDCDILSSFILKSFGRQNEEMNSTMTETTEANFKMVNTTDVESEQLSTVLPSSDTVTTSVINPNLTQFTANASQNETDATTSHPGSSSTLITSTSSTQLGTAEDVRIKPVDLTTITRCFGMKVVLNKTKIVPCALLQPYVEKITLNSAITRVPTFYIVLIILIYNVTIL